MNTESLVEIVLDIDLNKEPECESVWHQSDPSTHGGPVTHWMVTPCGHGGLRCAGKVRHLLQPQIVWVRCGRCDALHDADEVKFIEI